MKRELDLVVLSDVHLGTYGCHARELLNYLSSIKVKTLVLNGDFIDMWQFRKSYFPKEHIRVIQKILRMASKGTVIYYITGNHDDALRKYSDFSAGNIHLRDKLVLQVNGRSCWIFHGDVFDMAINFSPWLAKLGGKSYDYLIWLNRFVNDIRAWLGMSRISMAHQVKQQFKEALKYISDFEHTAIEHAVKQGYDCVICGHIHRPQLRTVSGIEKPILYLNSGDWVENLTAIECRLGNWSIYTYKESDFSSSSMSNEEDIEGEGVTHEFFQSFLASAAGKRR